MSPEANKILHFILKELGGLGYGYRQTIEGCFDAAVNNYKMSHPPEGKDVVVDEVLKILREI